MNTKTLTPSFDEIREILKELSISHKEAKQEMKEIRASHKEAKQEMKEIRANHKESKQEMKEMFTKTDQQIAENNKDFRRLRNLFETQWGRLVESLVKGKLLQLLNERGIEVQNLSQRTESAYTREDGKLQQKEFDIVAVNGDEVVAVEVKTTLTPGKVKYFTDSLKDFKKYFTHYQNLKIYGAMAYLRSESEAHLFAQRQGLFVIRATGDSASLINTKDFKPKVFA